MANEPTLVERLRRLGACEPGCQGRCAECPDDVAATAADHIEALERALAEADTAGRAIMERLATVEGACEIQQQELIDTRAKLAEALKERDESDAVIFNNLSARGQWPGAAGRAIARHRAAKAKAEPVRLWDEGEG